MDENEYRTKEIEWFNKSLDKRVERWKQIVPATYNVSLPELVWGYLSMTDEMYVSGQFAGVVIFCASITELILVDRIKAEEVCNEREWMGLKRLIKIAYALGILNDAESTALNELRKLRNSLAHGKAGKLAEMAKKRYTVVSSDDSFLTAGFYVNSGFFFQACFDLGCVSMASNVCH